MFIFTALFSMKNFQRKWLALFLALSVVLFTPHTTSAQSIDVSASVSTPLPTSPAVITSPANQSHLPSTTTTIGTCPANGAYVVIQRRAARIGTTSCDNGQFAVPVSLIEGANELSAQVYNITDDAGPSSPTITIYYDEPLPIEADTPAEASTPPLSPDSFRVPFVQEDGISCTPTAIRLSHAPYSPINHKEKLWHWNIAVTGGCPPYTLSIAWGDGSSETQIVPEEATLSLKHTYTAAGSFKPIFTFTDHTGTEAVMQLLAVVTQDSPTAEPTSPPADPMPLYEVIAYAATAIITVGVGAAALQAVRPRIKKP